jgi:hypothetical protein
VSTVIPWIAQTVMLERWGNRTLCHAFAAVCLKLSHIILPVRSPNAYLLNAIGAMETWHGKIFATPDRSLAAEGQATPEAFADTSHQGTIFPGEVDPTTSDKLSDQRPDVA